MSHQDSLPKDTSKRLRRKLIRLMEDDVDLWIKMEDDSLAKFAGQYPPPAMKAKYPNLPW